MKFLFASDSFKGTLSSEKIISILEEEAFKVFPDCKAKGVAVADGGEGTVDAVVAATGGSPEYVDVKGPLWEDVKSSYGRLDDNRAIIEMAKASGLPMVALDKRNPLNTTSYGTGQLINDALSKGYRDITITLGGSATNDGGIGALRALGIKFFDKENNELLGEGKDLCRIADIDISGMNPLIEDADFTVMCDVDNPLLGERGATYTFGMQKGADDEKLSLLESGMKNYANIVAKIKGDDLSSKEGAGAAGGLGFAFLVFLNARLKSGIEAVLDLIDFDKLLEDADICITGEGRIDWQSAHGKVPSGIGKRCMKKNIPAIAIVGGMGKGADDIYEQGIYSIITTINSAMDIEEALLRADELYRNAACRAFRMLKAGMDIKNKK